jgi:ankyrin repeat protein
VNANASVDQADDEGTTPLCVAAQEGHTAVVELLVRAKADLDKASNTGATPLKIAAQGGHTAIVELLVRAKASLDQASNQGVTPLAFAAQNGHTGVVELLVRAKASLDKANNQGVTPLIKAAYTGHSTIVKLLVKARADVAAVERYEHGSALHFAARLGKVESVRQLLKHPHIDPAQPARNSSTALHWAAMAGQKECCALLAKRGGLSVEQLDDLKQLVPPVIQAELKLMQCAGCGRARQLEDRFKKCSRCLVARFCSRECQMQHWKRHKAVCVKPAKEEEKKEVDFTGRRVVLFGLQTAALNGRAGLCSALDVPSGRHTVVLDGCAGAPKKQVAVRSCNLRLTEQRADK